MTTLVGGVRTRMIQDSFRNMIVDGLTDLGWFDTNRKHRPIRIIDRPNKWDDPIEFNSMVISLEDRDDSYGEMGSNYMIDTWTAYIDFYAESDPLGMQVQGDVRDILRGKIPSIGRTDSCFDVYDYRMATPVAFTTVQINNVVDDRARNFPNAWQAHWFVVRAELEDDFLDEEDT